MIFYAIITAVGPDRPGLVDQLSAFLAQRNLNIESSRMAVLGGEFAVLMLISGEEAEIEKLLADPAALAQASSLQVFLKKTSDPSARALPPSLPYRISTAGMDHPGIVHEVSRVLHQFGVNIEVMDTGVSPAPVSGTPIFALAGEVAVPAEVKIRELRQALLELGDRLNMEITFEPLEKG